MCPYCAHICIMGWRIMLQEKFFLFEAWKLHFHFPSAKNGAFCEATTKWQFYNGTTTFFKNIRPSYMDNISTGGVSNLSVHPWQKRQIPAESVGSGSDLNY